MSQIIAQDFNAGPNGSTATTVQVGASSTTGSGGVYDNTDPIEGAFCLKFGPTTGSIRWDYAAAGTVWHSFYFKTPAAAPAGNETIANWFLGTTQVGSLRMQSDMTVAVRDVSSATVSTVSPLPPDTWVRGAVKVVPGSPTGHVVRLYVGANKHGSTPDYIITTSATNSGASATDNVRIGAVTGGLTYYVDRLRSDNATEPAGMTGVGPPTVSAGPDLTKDAGGSPFTITGVEVPGGAPIASRQWRVVSGTAVTLTNATSATVTVTPPVSTGSTVLGYKATDTASMESAEDTMTVTWVTAGQAFRPIGDVSAGSWTATPAASPMSSNIDEAIADSSDYVESPANPSGNEYKFRLESKPGPSSTSGVILEVQLWLSAAATSQSTVVTLYDSDGTTVRKTQTFTDLTTTPTVRQIALTSGEAAAITGWNSGLVVGVKPTVS